MVPAPIQSQEVSARGSIAKSHAHCEGPCMAASSGVVLWGLWATLHSSRSQCVASAAAGEQLRGGGFGGQSTHCVLCHSPQSNHE